MPSRTFRDNISESNKKLLVRKKINLQISMKMKSFIINIRKIEKNFLTKRYKVIYFVRKGIIAYER